MEIPYEIIVFLNSNDYKYINQKFHYDPKLKSTRKLAIDSVFEIIKPYYESNGHSINNGLFNFLVEPLKNSNFYSLADSGREGVFELFLESKSLVAGYFDGGDYFKRKDVKECWENRIYHKEKRHVESDQVGYGIGTQLIYGIADLIFVDNLAGKLYTGINFEINPSFKRTFLAT